ncbi:hypothetical protein OS493_008790 [Desmophyllum pertusum]|uniref:Uncharacterized protein n=1 Tax=Desmophyllum pertusum TaxID=174260 RepID=A0A9X0CYL2_9CNID|nr:hypothetical protein OS493_008790 [Desmophyllum pertusum]
MVKGENGATLPKIPEGTATHNEDIPVAHSDSRDMPSLDECHPYFDSDGQHVNVDKIHLHQHYRTISEREQFEKRGLENSLTLKERCTGNDKKLCLAQKKRTETSVLVLEKSSW